MKLYLAQHGKPVPKERDPERPLSEEGRAEVEKIAGLLKETSARPETVFHSGKTRARETAEIFSSRLCPGKKAVERQGLAPLDDIHGIARELGRNKGDWMIVGHLPHLGKLAAFLVTGKEAPEIVSFQQGGVLCLHREEGEVHWKIAWMVVPELLGV